jgi:hypothetical protein
MGPPCFLVAKILKTESDHFDRFEVGFHPNPNFAKNGHRRRHCRRNRSCPPTTSGGAMVAGSLNAALRR